MKLQTNSVPWLEALTLISYTYVQDAAGYEVKTQVTDEVSCCFSEGVARGEFYEASKAGLRASCTAEVWADDYSQQPFASHDGILYEVLRSFPSGRGTIYLILSEVVR